MTEVLQSLALLGRMDSLGRTFHGGPARLATLPWEEGAVDEARQPLSAPTGMVPAVAPEDDPTMTIALPPVGRPPQGMG